jgi:8-oxo-dGTP pyrophosphatase MutT (NUDIX family)
MTITAAQAARLAWVEDEIQLIETRKLWRPRIVKEIQAAKVALLDDLGRILLGEREDGRGWDLPGGHIEAGETPGGAALRETDEEVGLTIEVKRELGLYDEGRCVVYEATIVSGQPFPDGAEMVNVEWFAPDALPNQLFAPIAQAIQDAVKIEKGEAAGHEFRGNQYEEGESGSEKPTTRPWGGVIRPINGARPLPAAREQEIRVAIGRIPVSIRSPRLEVVVQPGKNKYGQSNLAEYSGSKIIIWSGWFGGRSREDLGNTILHEMGHGVQAEAGFAIRGVSRQELKDTWGETRILTWYSSKNADEGWAEAFMLRIQDPSRSFGPKTDAIFKKLGI